MLVKAGAGVLRFDAAARPLTEGEALRHLVHEDGLLRVPVLVRGDLLVRGFTEALYAEALDD